MWVGEQAVGCRCALGGTPHVPEDASGIKMKVKIKSWYSRDPRNAIGTEVAIHPVNCKGVAVSSKLATNHH